MPRKVQKTPTAVPPKAKPSMQEYSAAIVRPSDSTGQMRYPQINAAEGVQRFTKYAYKCITINANAVASVPWNLYRKSRKGVGSFKASAISAAHKSMLRAKARVSTRKAIDMSEDLEVITDPDHPARKLLDNPNPQTTWHELAFATEAYCALGGQCGWYKVRGMSSAPRELYPMNPMYTRPVPDRDQWIAGFVFGRTADLERFYDRKDVAFFQRFNPLDPFNGMPDIAACFREQDLSIAFSQMFLATIDNGARPGLVILMPGATIDQRKQVEAVLEAKYRGSTKSEKPLVMTGKDVEVVQWAQQTRELSYLTSDEKTRDTICNVLGVPLAFVTMDSASLAQAKEATPMWQRQTIAPRIRAMEDIINQEIIEDFRVALNDPTLFFAFDDPVDRDWLDISTRMTNLYGAGIITKNEARRELSFDADAMGDGYKESPDPFGALSFGTTSVDTATPTESTETTTQPEAKPQRVPIEYANAVLETVGKVTRGELTPDAAKVALTALYGVDAETAATLVDAAAKGPEKTTGRPQKTQEDQNDPPNEIPDPPPDDNPPAPDDSTKGLDDGPQPPVHRTSEFWHTRKSCSCCKSTPEAAERGASLEKGGVGVPRIIVTSEAAMSQALRAFFAQIAPKVVAGVNYATGELTYVPSADPDAFKAFNQATAQQIYDLLTEGYGAAVASDLEPIQRVGNADVALFSQRAGQAVADYQGKLFATVTQTVENRVREVLQTSIAAGEPIADRVSSIKELMGPGTEYAADRIAMTETMRAYHIGRETAWQESGQVAGKEWLLSGNPCPICVTLSKRYRIAAIGAPFIARGQNIIGENGAVLAVNDYADIDGPPGHPNCRCGLAAVFIEVKE